MSPPPAQLLPLPVLFELLPAAFEPWGSSASLRSRPPSDASVSRIATETGVRLPSLFVEVARACPAYGGWFGSIGDDFDSHNHLLAINRSFRDQGLSPRYVLLNHGHDGDCDAWDTAAPPSVDGAFPIVYFRLADRGQTHDLRPVAQTFAAYIDAFVRARAPRCPVKRLRRGAKQVLDDI